MISRIAQWYNRRRDVRFDALHGVQTEGWEAGRWGTQGHTEAYSPTPTRLFERIIRKARINPAQFAFLDIGAGKGRTLLLASACGFKPVIGVELDEHLCALGRDNLDRWDDDRARPILVHADARDAPIPDGHVFVFMFNPFTGPVFEAVARRLATAAAEPGRAVVVAYTHDVCGDVLEQTGRFRRLRIRPLRFWAPPKTSLFYNEAAWTMRSRPTQ